MNQYVCLWAQLGVLNYDQYQRVKTHFGDLENAWKKINYSFLCQLGFGVKKAQRILEIRERIDIKDLFKQIEKHKINIFCIDDEQYPSPLKNIDCPPPFLFVRGKLPLLHKSIGIVGTRKITDYGKLVTEKLTSELVQNGFIIISGLALGVDAQAHATTLENKGITIGVLGSGVDLIYPKNHQQLGESILKNRGAIVSEYPIGTQPARHHFPQRNRIISGLSRGTLVTEGGKQSGALITARYALDQGREVFAIPNNINKKGLSGTNHLIRKGEAKLIEKASDILVEFKMEPCDKKQELIQFSALESEIIEHITNESKSMDELIQKTPYNIAKLSEILIELQLKGVVREVNRQWMII